MGKVGEAAIELVLKAVGSGVPLALDNGEAGSQVNPDVGRAGAAAALGAGGEAVVAKELGEEDVGGFFADRLGAGWHGA